MPPTALSIQYTDEDDIEALLSVEGVDGRLDDNADGSISATELTRLTTYAVNYATARINQFCLLRYSATDLDASWVINDFATVIACRWLCSRRGNSVPKSIEALFKEVMEELKMIQKGESALSDIAERNVNTPAWSNGRVSLLYSIKKYRVERPLSESTPTDYSQTIDHRADAAAPYEY